MFTSKSANMVDLAVLDCINYGSGEVSQKLGATTFKAYAVFAENETDIEVAVYEGALLLLGFTEQIPEEYR